MKSRSKTLVFATVVLLALSVIVFTCFSIAKQNGLIGNRIQLPDSASDVYQYSDFAAEEAEFQIAEKDFLAFCNKNGWSVEAIENPVPYFYPTWGSREDNRLVKRGYHCNIPNGVVIFDTEHSRASLRVSEFP
jgi:hypothetical protein